MSSTSNRRRPGADIVKLLCRQRACRRRALIQIKKDQAEPLLLMVSLAMSLSSFFPVRPNVDSPGGQGYLQQRVKRANHSDPSGASSVFRNAALPWATY